jgi:hypothetical protein
MRRRSLMRAMVLTGWACALGMGAGPVGAHMMIDADAAARMLGEVEALSANAASGSAEHRAAALVDLGQALTRAINLLNQDLVAHDGQLGVTSQALIGQLQARGVQPVWSAALERYLAPLEPFAQALAIAPHGERAGDARFRLIAGRFYDSFAIDPLQPLDPDWQRLSEDIAAAEAFLEAHPNHPGRIETEFILAIEHARAATLAPTDDARAKHAQAAQALLHAFEDLDPYSTRTVTLRQLLEVLPPGAKS